MSPEQETPAQKAREREIAREIGRHFDREVVEYPKFCTLDYYLKESGVNGKMTHLIEIRQRGRAKHAYATVMLNLDKYLALWHGQECHKVPAIYVVEFTDCICYIDIENVLDQPVVIRGRGDRGIDEREPGFDIDVTLLTELPW